MRFENIYGTRVDQMEDSELVAFVRSYRTRRASDITPVVTDIPAKARASMPKLSDAEMALLKRVGLTARALKNLRTEVEEEDDDGLFSD